MKSVIFLLIFCSVIFAQNRTIAPLNPCNDVLYRQLLSVPLDSMSQREYSYFITKHDECSKFQANSVYFSSVQKQQDVKNKVGWLFIGIAIFSIFMGARVVS